MDVTIFREIEYLLSLMVYKTNYRNYCAYSHRQLVQTDKNK
jgi:hypothetical protein